MKEIIKQIGISFKKMIELISISDESVISHEGREILSDPEKKKIFLDAVERADKKRKEEKSTELIREELHFPDGEKMIVLI
jgi:hypothetical protein